MSSYDVDIWFAVNWEIKYPNSLQTIYKGRETEGQNGREDKLLWFYMTIYTNIVYYFIHTFINPYIESINCKRLNILIYSKKFQDSKKIPHLLKFCWFSCCTIQINKK